MTNPIAVKSVARGISECDPIVLMESADKTRRLVFIPVIHNNPKKDWPAKGAFVYQRKLKADEWDKITIEGESLNRLKAGEGYKLELDSHALGELIGGLMDIEEIAEQVKKGRTNTTFVPSRADMAPILAKLIENSTDEQITTELAKLGRDQAVKINDLILHARIRSALKYWEEHKNDSTEENWQKYFSDRPWILSLLCPEPIIIMKSKMYVGGTNASGSGGKTVDYGFINKNTNNTALMEIKTPVAKLLAKEYRGIYPPSWDLAGAVTQVQNYKYHVLKNLPALKEDYGVFDAVNIPTYVITGNTAELTSDTFKRSFELYRKNLSGTIVLTFDEVFQRLRLLLSD
ncbi:Shedu immune nuclease family protein [Mycobacterium vicinigordonae]|uniref:DUF4263 domain-containing protein n=1 Tax=Mycobacterium vicinigordonae TaxID=1719132 RepID=A0A7D6E7P5_9MYCO|nr:Shedu immune nuclease family protein [Mycobacterium vicinigordonae]QLL08643.1 DUF4263 domain-containing protein [Mycobacterium vicinigordonae]